MFSLDCPEWFASSPCVGQDRLFFSSHPADRKTATSICMSDCPNVDKCLEYAVKSQMTIGVWGGKTGPELSRLVNISV